MNYSYLLEFALTFSSGGVIVAIINKLTFSKKEAADYGLELVREMYRQHEDMKLKLHEIEHELLNYKMQYESLLKDHNELRNKYNKLKSDFDILKNKP